MEISLLTHCANQAAGAHERAQTVGHSLGSDHLTRHCFTAASCILPLPQVAAVGIESVELDLVMQASVPHGGRPVPRLGEKFFGGGLCNGEAANPRFCRPRTHGAVTTKDFRPPNSGLVIRPDIRGATPSIEDSSEDEDQAKLARASNPRGRPISPNVAGGSGYLRLAI